MIDDPLQAALKMPWVFGYELRRFLALPYIRFLFALHGITWGRNWHVWGMPIIQRYGGSAIKIGDGVYLRSWRSSNPLVPQHPVVFATRNREAQIIIGNNVGLTGTTIVSSELIEIGDRVQVGSNATIVDTDFHPLSPIKRQTDFLAGEHVPVIIENDVFIGMNALILKGSRICHDAVIGAGSIVTGEIPAGVIAAGNPAKVVRMID